ncbi:hypothetical protein WA577_002718, partial [Blastocystis sp. JDR]
EESDRQFLEQEILGVLDKYNQTADDSSLLKDIISYSYLILHKKKIQSSLLSNCKYIDYDLNDSNNCNARAAMQRIADSVRVTRVAKINLTNFYSVEASMSMKAIDNSDVFLSVSFLRSEDVLRKNGKWSVVDYSLHCGQDLDNMFPLLKLSFAYKGTSEPSCLYGFDPAIEEEKDEDPIIDESSDDLPITAEFSDGYVASEEEMSEVDEQSEEEKEKPEEELIKFEVVNDSLATLCNLLNPQMPADVFLMYLVSLQLWETTWNIDERFYDLMVDRPIFTEPSA